MNVRTAGWFLLVGLLMVGLTACGSSPDTSNLEGKTATVYRSPSCSCCKRYIDYLESNGMNVTDRVTNTRELVRAEHGIPRKGASCHTSVIDGYAVEGHVPVQAISKLLKQQPQIAGITIPGMPKHAPGMMQANGSTLRVKTVKQDGTMGDVYREITY